MRPPLATAAAVLAAAAGSLAASLTLEPAPLRAGLALLALAAFAAPYLPGARRLSAAAHQRLLAMAAATVLVHAMALDLWRLAATPWVRVWNVYHYYLGAEYFEELGYFDLYDATLEADRQGADSWRGIDQVRDLRTYRVEPRSLGEATYEPRDHFSPERWEEFRRDVAALQTQMPPRRWRSVFRDRGYNATPFWTALARRATGLLPAESTAALKLLAAGDLVLFAVTFWLLRRTFGARAALLAALFLALSPVNQGRLVGGFLQYDWLAALAMGLVFLRRGRPVAAGAALAYATMARVFPLILVGSALLPAVARWVKSGRPPRRTLPFAAAFACFCLAGVGIGCTAGRGPSAWREFAANMRHHTEEHTYGEQRVGLKHVFTHDVASLDFEESGGERRRTFARQQGIYRAVAGLFVALFGLAVLRRNRGDAFLLGLVPFYALTVASRYYWACLALLPLSCGADPAARRRRDGLAFGQAALYAGFYLHALFRPERYAAYSALNLLLAGLLAAALGLFLSRDLAVRRRRRARRRRPARLGRPFILL